MKQRHNDDDERNLLQPKKRKLASFPLARVAALFILLVVIFHATIWLLTKSSIEWIQEITVNMAVYLISLTGIRAEAQHTFIVMPNALWEVTLECTALSAIFVFISLVIAYPASSMAKAIGLAAGIVMIFCANIMRLFMLAWATHIHREAALYFHDYVWQLAFLGLILYMWYLWLEMVVRNENSKNICR